MLTGLALFAALGASAPEPKIDLYTMGEGEHVFERFGHAAICVAYDRAPQLTRCYNYGTTDFASPPQKLGWELLTGTSRFWVSVWPESKMLAAYRRADRSIWRQRLPISADAARAIASKLASDAREEHRYYVYHHFDDNCSTRLRDIVDRNTGGSLSNTESPFGRTYRDLGREGLAEQPALLQLGNLFVGRRADTQMSTFEAMFHPTVLRETVKDRLGAQPELIYQRKGRSLRGVPPAEWPWQVALGAFLAAPVALARRARRFERLGIVGASAVLGTLGLLLWFVAGVSQVPELRINEALLVFWPSDIALPWLSSRWRQRYVRLRLLGLLLVSLLAAVGVLKQPLLALVLVPGLVHAALLAVRAGTSAPAVEQAEPRSPTS